jgi:hypothetical protein
MNPNFSDVTTYFLVLELLEAGEAGLLPSLEPISMKSIAQELILRSGHDHGTNAEKWAYWFIGNPDHGTELERANLLMFLKAQKRHGWKWYSLKR